MPRITHKPQTVSARGGFRHIQHVRPNRAPTKRGPHRPEIVERQLSNAESRVSTLNSDNSSNIAYSSHVSTECFCTLMSENLCEGGAPTFLPNRARSGLNLALVSGPQVQHRGRRTVATAVSSPYVQVYTCLLLSDLPMDAVSCYRRTLYTC